MPRQKQWRAIGKSSTPNHIGDWRILTKLGTGGSASVYHGQHMADRRNVALKMIDKNELLKNDFDTEEAMFEALELEARIMELCSKHENIINIIDTIDDGSFRCFVMPLGKCNLAQYINSQKDQKASISDTRRFGMQLISAIAYVHKCGVTHNDIKLDNCILDSQGRLKLVDFGLSTLYSVATVNEVVEYGGTQGYLAPEIVKQSNHSQPVDIWAFGICFYILLSGFFPFRSDTVGNLLADIAQATYRSLVLKLLPNAISIFQKIFSMLPENRITAEELLKWPWWKEDEDEDEHRQAEDDHDSKNKAGSKLPDNLDNQSPKPSPTEMEGMVVTELSIKEEGAKVPRSSSHSATLSDIDTDAPRRTSGILIPSPLNTNVLPRPPSLPQEHHKSDQDEEHTWWSPSSRHIKPIASHRLSDDDFGRSRSSSRSFDNFHHSKHDVAVPFFPEISSRRSSSVDFTMDEGRRRAGSEGSQRRSSSVIPADLGRRRVSSLSSPRKTSRSSSECPISPAPALLDVRNNAHHHLLPLETSLSKSMDNFHIATPLPRRDEQYVEERRKASSQLDDYPEMKRGSESQYSQSTEDSHNFEIEKQRYLEIMENIDSTLLVEDDENRHSGSQCDSSGAENEITPKKVKKKKIKKKINGTASKDLGKSNKTKSKTGGTKRSQRARQSSSADVAPTSRSYGSLTTGSKTSLWHAARPPRKGSTSAPTPKRRSSGNKRVSGTSRSSKSSSPARAKRNVLPPITANVARQRSVSESEGRDLATSNMLATIRVQRKSSSTSQNSFGGGQR
eukprot:m.185834 g.185834  ORF g.185834 m.185834 type:complete len:791 (-) comp15584_c0_seq3:3651-6023(-)